MLQVINVDNNKSQYVCECACKWKKDTCPRRTDW